MAVIRFLINDISVDLYETVEDLIYKLNNSK